MEQIIEDILVAALEGGSNYWIEKFKFVSGSPRYVLKHDEGLELFKAGGCLLVINEDGSCAHELTTEQFTAALRDYAAQQSQTPEDLHDTHDADDADTILQTALFGEVVYG